MTLGFHYVEVCQIFMDHLNAGDSQVMVVQVQRSNDLGSMSEEL